MTRQLSMLEALYEKERVDEELKSAVVKIVRDFKFYWNYTDLQPVRNNLEEIILYFQLLGGLERRSPAQGTLVSFNNKMVLEGLRKSRLQLILMSGDFDLSKPQQKILNKSSKLLSKVIKYLKDDVIQSDS